MKTLVINKVLDVNVSFLTLQDEDTLRNSGLVCGYELDNYGWLVIVPEDFTDDAEEFSNDFSVGFIAVLSAAKRAKCDYIKFDVDGTQYTDAELKI